MIRLARWSPAFVLLLAQAVFGQVNWVQLSPATSPSPRAYHAMAYDAARGQVVMFGGNTDTWVWDGTNWTQKMPATSPPARTGSAMVYDSSHNQVVLFGGIAGGVLSDTWVWDGTTWTQKSPANSPPARRSHAMAYDAAHNQVVLFSGVNLSGVGYTDTWVWDGTNWTQKSPATSPPVRFGHAMAYDAAHGQVVLFGGANGGGVISDTWIWDGTTWTQFVGTSPPGRVAHAMAYDGAHNQVVLFGGSGVGFLSDTWVWDGTTWTQKSPATSPPGRDGHAMAYDAAHGQMVLFGGEAQDSTYTFYKLADTWVYTASPTFTKAFNPSQISLSSTSTLTFKLTNTDPSLSLTGVSFTDTLPSGLTFPNTGTSSQCGGTVTVTANKVTLAAGQIAAGSSCSIALTVTGASAGVWNNQTTGGMSTDQYGTTPAASATLTVVAPPAISKKFNPAAIPISGTAILRITLTNPNASGSLTGVAFNDTMPAGLTLVSASFSAGCGSPTLSGWPGAVNLSGATVAVGTDCVITAFVRGVVAGLQSNITGNVTSTEGGTGATASDTITVIAPPTISKTFGASSILQNATTSLTFTITNPNASGSLTGVSFTDTMPSGLTVVGSPSLAGCGTATIGGLPGAINLSGATVAAGTNCVITATVQGTAVGFRTNRTGVINSIEGGAGGTATDSILVIGPPSITKKFRASSIPLNGTTLLTFTIINPNRAAPAEVLRVSFTDTMPDGLVVVGSPYLDTCDAVTISGLPGALNFSGSITAPCIITATVQGTKAGFWTNTTSNITSDVAGTGNSASDSITVTAPDLTATKTDSVNNSTTIGNNWTWTIHVANTGNADAVFPTGSTILNDNLQSLGITYGAPSVGNTTGTISGPINCAISAATLTCTANGAPVTIGAASAFDVTVQANPVAVTGMFFNPSAGGTCVVDPANVIVESNKNNNTCADSVTVTGPNPNGGFQIRYAANLAAGESYVNLTNTGASQGASICANVYTFSPDEQLISCCSCLITPNAIVSLGVKADLVSNTLTPAVPGSVVIKVASSLAVSNTCSPANPGTFNVPGLAAWGTSLHAVGSAYQQSETPFSASTPSLSEYNRITQLCSFINTAGSGYGICKSCRSGALGGAKQ